MTALFDRLTYEDVAKTIDHSLLRPELDDEFIQDGCELAARYKVASVCVRPADVPRAAELLAGAGVAVGTVVGFPHGGTTTEVKLFEADTTRKTYTPGLSTFIVSPANARKQLSGFIKQARKQLLIYDPKIADSQIMRLLEDHAKAGLDIKIIGSIAARSANLPVAPLTSMRLHTRTIIVDGHQAFVGSQSLRKMELDSRREIGIIVRDKKVVNTLLATFEKDWAATGFSDSHAAVKEDDAEPPPEYQPPELGAETEGPVA